MHSIELVKQLLKDDVIIQPTPTKSNQNYTYKLSEPDSDYTLEIKGVPLNSVIIKCDKFPSTSNFFDSKNNECKRSDYVIISQEDKLIIIIELKRSKNSSSYQDVIAQLKGATCIVKYCELLIEEFLKRKKIFSQYKYRYIKFQAKIQKRSFNNKNNPLNDTPEKMKTLYDSSTYYKKLI